MREVDFSERTVAQRWREIKLNLREDYSCEAHLPQCLLLPDTGVSFETPPRKVR